jgi:outer membrane protein assembly factor BamB
MLYHAENGHIIWHQPIERQLQTTLNKVDSPGVVFSTNGEYVLCDNTPQDILAFRSSDGRLVQRIARNVSPTWASFALQARQIDL